jgi:hypothetical protein
MFKDLNGVGPTNLKYARRGLYLEICCTVNEVIFGRVFRVSQNTLNLDSSDYPDGHCVLHFDTPSPVRISRTVK